MIDGPTDKNVLPNKINWQINLNIKLLLCGINENKNSKIKKESSGYKETSIYNSSFVNIKL